MRNFIIFLLLLSFFPCAAKAETNLYLFLGNKEKQKGNYQEAEKYFSKSAQEFNDYESWYNLSVVQSYRKEFPAAEKSIKRAIQISPGNQDAHLHLARVYVWSEKYPQAQKTVEKILVENPNNSEAKELQARIFLYQKKYDQAQATVDSANKNDATEKLLMDIKSAKKDAEIDQLKWRLSYGQSRTKFSRVKQNDWRNSFGNLSYKFDEKTILNLSYEDVRRFNTHNHQIGFNADRKFSDKYQAYVGALSSSNASFLPKWSYRTGGSVKVINDGDFKHINNLWLLLDLQYDDFAAAKIKMVKFGLRYDVMKDVALTLKHIGIIPPGGRYLSGVYSRLDWVTPLNGLSLYTGYANAPETQNAVVIDTESIFGGLAYDINRRVTLYIAYSHDDRQRSYIANTGSAALAIKF